MGYFFIITKSYQKEMFKTGYPYYKNININISHYTLSTIYMT